MHLCILSYIHISSLVKKLSVQFARLEIVFTFYRKTLPLYIVQFSKNLLPFRAGGDKQNRTADPLLARQVLSQLSYTPILY